jgi:Glyoxalase/Bleomycin resistance protein/Dioxygenase superfamily
VTARQCPGRDLNWRRHAGSSQNEAMPVPSRRLKEQIEGTVDHHASQRWPALEEVTISWRGSYGYLTGYLSEDDDDTIKLCRIQYLGDDTEWAFAIWQASTGSYADAVLLDGHRTGHPSQALDTACTLYLASPGDQPAEPLKNLRGAALEQFALIVDDYDRAIRFFVDVLGFDLVEDSPSLTNDGRAKRWVVVRPPAASVRGSRRALCGWTTSRGATPACVDWASSSSPSRDSNCTEKS